MRQQHITCNTCRTVVPFSRLEEYEGVDHYMYHCPCCSTLLATRPYPETAPHTDPCCRTNDFSLTADELRYTIHCLGKQGQKLDHARKQLSNTVTKLEIMLEIAKEKCE